MAARKIALKEGQIANEWFIAREEGTYCVKRMVGFPGEKRSAQRAIKQDYEKYLNAYTDREIDEQARNPGSEPKPPRALEDYVIRLNGKDPKEERLKAQVLYGHAWINDDFLTKYREDILYTSIQDRTNADTQFNYLKRYGLNWFLSYKGVHQIQAWKELEKEWGKYLRNMPEDQESMVPSLRIFRDDADDLNLRPATRQLSAKVLKSVLFEVNRFIRFIYDKRSSEFTDGLIELKPWGPNYLEGYRASWRVKHQPRLSKYIIEPHWNLIVEAMKKQNIVWRHQVHLARDYGLRRRETMGLEELSVRPDHLHLVQQLEKSTIEGGRQIRHFKGLKGHEHERKIPHWFNPDPKVTRKRIRTMLEQKIPHPDTLSKGFREFCKNIKDKDGVVLNLDYIFHDLRRTFITNAVKAKVPVEDLIMATGHKSEGVLRKFYLMDYRELESDMDIGDDDDDIEV